MESIILRPDGRRYTYVDLALATDDVLERIMRAGRSPDVRNLAGWEFKGFNVLDVTALLGFRKFKKGFYAPTPPQSASVKIRGYNVKVVQNGIEDPWEPVLRSQRPVRHGYYDVYPVDPGERDNLYPNALLINYNCGRNPFYDPTNLLRDYLVQVYADNPDLLLGKAYLAIGPWRVPVSYFVLERYNQPEPGANFP